jgi:hypothetical protein
MIPVIAKPEPEDFDARVRQPGIAFLQQLGLSQTSVAPSKLQWKSHWQNCLEQLADAYERICAYSSFRVHPITGSGSVDHFVPKSRKPYLAYEWSNFRFASSRLNSRKRDKPMELDPFTMPADVFTLSFVDFSISINGSQPGNVSQNAREALTILKIDDALHRHERKRLFEQYQSGQISAEVLRAENPFVFQQAQRERMLAEWST